MKKILHILSCFVGLLAWVCTAQAQCDDGSDGCLLTIEMTDAYGDGWTGNSISIKQNGTVLGTYTISDGASASATLTVCPSAGTITVSYDNSGEYPEDVAFTISDPSGAILVYEEEDPWSGDQVIEPCPSCPKPSNLAIASLGETTATISWEESGSASLWEYRLTDSDSWLTTSSTSASLTALEANTIYTIEVRSVCSDDETSQVSSFTFRTNCGAADAPYLTDFEEYDASTRMPYCWERLESYSTTGYYGNTWPYVGTYPNYSHSGTNTLLFRANSNNTVVSGAVDIDPSKINLSFYIRSNPGAALAAATIDVGYVPASSGNPLEDFVLVGTVSGYTAGAIEKREVDFDTVTYTGSVRIMIRVPTYTGSNDCYIYMDDVLVQELSPCPRVKNFALMHDVAEGMLLVQWDSEATQAEIVVVPNGEDVEEYPNAKHYTISGESEAVLDDLDNDTDYDVYIRALCGDAQGYWEEPIKKVRPNVYTLSTPIDTLTACGFTLTDDGGLSGTYSVPSLYQITLYPTDPDLALHISGSVALYSSSAFGANFYIYAGESTDGTPADSVLHTTATIDYYNNGPVTLVFDASKSTSTNYTAAGLNLRVDCVEPSYCDNMASIALGDVTAEGAEIFWKPVGIPSEGYQLKVEDLYDENATPDIIDIDFPEDTSYIVPLPGRSLYRISISTVCEGGNGFAMTYPEVLSVCEKGGEMPLGDMAASTTTGYAPYHRYYKNSLSQMVYLREEMAHALDTIYGIQLYCTQTANHNNTTRIYITTSDATTIATKDDYVVASPADLVFEGQYKPVVGLNTIIFEKPWITNDTTKNIVLTFVKTAPSYTSGQIQHVIYTLEDGRKFMYRYADATVYDATEAQTGGYYVNGALAINFLEPCGRSLCLGPKVTTGEITETTASFTWVPGGDETAWKVQYRIVGEEDWTVAAESTSDDNIILTDLTQGKQYEGRFTALCGDGSTGFRTVFFNTNCGFRTLPIDENFENFTATQGNSATEYCWNRTSFYPYNGTFPCLTTASVGGYKSQKGLNFDRYGSALILPEVNASLNQLGFNFYASKSSASYDLSLQIGYCSNYADTATYVVVRTIPIQSYYGVQWDNYYATFEDLDPEATGRVFIRAQANELGNIYIDSLIVDFIPACRELKSATVSNITSTSITISVEEEYPHSGYKIRYNTVDDFASASFATSTSNPAKLTGLTPGTIYYLWINGTCSGYDDGIALRLDSVRTFCEAIAVTDDAPYINELDDDDDYTCFNMQLWNSYNAVAYPYSGTSALCYTPENGKEGVLIFPTFNFENLSTDADLSLYMIHRNLGEGYAIYPAEVNLYVRQDPEGDWTFVQTLPNSTGSWMHIIATLPNSKGASTYQVKLITTGGGSSYSYGNIYHLHIDNIEVGPYIDCRPPSSLTIEDITERTAMAKWDDESSSTYRVQYRNATDWSWSSRIVSDEQECLLSPLEANSTYEVRLAALCEDGQYSDYSPITTFSTPMCEQRDSTHLYASADPEGQLTLNVYRETYIETYIPASLMDGKNEPSYILFEILEPLDFKMEMEVYLSQPKTSSTIFHLSNTFNSYLYQDFILDSGFVGPVQLTLADFGNLNLNNGIVIGINFSHEDYDYEIDYETWNFNYIFQNHPVVLRSHTSSANTMQMLTINDANHYFSPDNIHSPNYYFAGTAIDTAQVADIELIGCANRCWDPVLRKTYTTSSTITIDWVKENHPVEVAIKKTSDADFGSTTAVPGGHTYTFSNLLPQTSYTIRLRANCSAASLGYTDWAEYEILTDTACSIPFGLTVSNVGAHSATLSWNAGDIHNNLWDIHVWNDGFDQIYEVTTNPVTITGLLPGNDYKVQLRSYCGIDNHVVSEWSEVKHIQNTCPPATAVHADVNGHDVTVSWTPGSLNTKWVVAYGLKDFAYNEAIEYRTVSEPTVTFENLKPGNTYSFRVRSLCADDWNSVWSSDATAQMVGIDDIETADTRLTLQPNPATAYTTLSIDNAEGQATVSILSIDGRTVQQLSTTESHLRLDLEGYAAGTYFVRVQTESWTAVRKLIVK